jgi:hypothetical protein
MDFMGVVRPARASLAAAWEYDQAGQRLAAEREQAQRRDARIKELEGAPLTDGLAETPRIVVTVDGPLDKRNLKATTVRQLEREGLL